MYTEQQLVRIAASQTQTYKGNMDSDLGVGSTQESVCVREDPGVPCQGDVGEAAGLGKVSEGPLHGASTPSLPVRWARPPVTLVNLAL